MIFRCLTAILAIAATLAGSALAQGGNRAVFMVPEVPVFAEADTAAAAQQIAQDRGRRRAMDILLRRLTAEEDWGYLPDLTEGIPASAVADAPEFDFDYSMTSKSAVALSPDQLSSYEEGFSIFDEKTSSRTYRARITYRFKPNAVRALLEDAGLPYSEAQARRALILPVLKTSTDEYLWESRNPWARAWLARPLGNELTPLVLPRGDRQDMSLAPLENVLGLNSAALAELADRYNTPQVLIAEGKLEESDDGEYLLNVRLIDAYLDGRGANRQRIDRAASVYDDEEGFGAAGTQQNDREERGRIVAEAFFRGTNNDFPALAQRAVETTVARYARGWKERTLVDHAAIRPLQLTGWFTSLDEWADIRIALENTPLVREMEIGVFTNQSAVIDLMVIGAQEQFVLALSQENLTVWASPDGRWNIADFDLARQLQAGLAEISMDGQRDVLGTADPQVNRPGVTQGVPERRGTPARLERGPTDLELPEELFGPDGEPNDNGSGSPVALEPLGGEGTDDDNGEGLR